MYDDLSLRNPINSTGELSQSIGSSEGSASSLLSLLSLDDFNSSYASSLGSCGLGTSVETGNSLHRSINDRRYRQDSQYSYDSQCSNDYYSNIFIACFCSLFGCFGLQENYYSSNKPSWDESEIREVGANISIGRSEICTPQTKKIIRPPAYGLECSLNDGSYVTKPEVKPGDVSTYIMGKRNSPPVGKAKSSPVTVMDDSSVNLLIQEGVTLSWAGLEKIAKAILKHSSRLILPKIVFNQSSGDVKSYQVSIKSSGCSNPDNFVWNYLFLLTQAGLGDDFVSCLLSSYWESENPFFSLLQEQGHLKIEFNLGVQNSLQGVAKDLPCDHNSMRSSLECISDYLQAKRNGDFGLSLKKVQDGSSASKIAVEMFYLGNNKGPLLSYDITYIYRESYLRNLIFCAYRNAKCNKNYISTCMDKVLASFEVFVSDSVLLSGMSFIEFGVDKLALFIREVAKSMDSLADCIEKNASLNLYDIIVLYNIKILCSVFENRIPAVLCNVNTMLGVDEDFSLCLKRGDKSIPLGAELLKNEQSSIYEQGMFGEVLRGLLHEENKKMLDDESAIILTMSI